MREKMNNDAITVQLQTSFDQAAATVEQVKIAMKRQEEEVRSKTAEALALKAQWKQAQIQSSITKALDGLSFENQFSGFGAAKDRISEMQSEAAARQEMLGSSVQGKIMAMEDKSRDMEAENELDALEVRLGLRSSSPSVEHNVQTVSIGGASPTPPPTAPNPAAQSEAEKQLEELEKRLKGS
jgi:phage shock protein A